MSASKGKRQGRPTHRNGGHGKPKHLCAGSSLLGHQCANLVTERGALCKSHQREGSQPVKLKLTQPGPIRSRGRTVSSRALNPTD
jgi:hypothetical protein